MEIDTLQARSSLFPALSARRFGSGKHVIVLIHGFPDDGTLWEHIIPALAEDFTIIVPDLPGAGNSLLDGESVSIANLSEGVRALLDAAGISEPFVIAGHSMGGYVALALAEKYPTLVAGISLVHSTAMADSHEKREGRSKVIALIRKGGREAFIRQMVPALFSPSFAAASLHTIQAQTAKGLKLSPESIIAFYTAMMNRPAQLANLENVNFPLQWIAGRDDSAIPYQHIIQQSFTTDVSFVSLYNGCGHMSMIEAPQQLTADLKTFAAWCTTVKQ